MTQMIGRLRADRSAFGAGTAPRARTDRRRVAARRTRPARRTVVNLAGVLGVVGLAVTVLARTQAAEPEIMSAALVLVAGLTIAGGSAAALLMVVAARLTGVPLVTWVGLLIGVFSLITIPIATVRGLDEHDVRWAAALVVAHATGVLLWLLVLAAPRPPAATRLVWGVLGAVTVLVLAATRWVALAPESAATAAGSRPWWSACALVWILGGLIVVGRASVAHLPGLGVVGAGLALLGGVQAGRVVLPSPAVESAPLFAALGLVAVAVVLCGALRVIRLALLRLNAEQALREAELWRAELRLARAAERDHDLRNGLAGLAGATAVMGGGTESAALSRIVAGELSRLDGLLAQPTGTDGAPAHGAYAVAPALDGLVMLRRSVGMDVRADVEPRLCASGSPHTLAQVVTNLLANAERHAPGSPVRIAAFRRGERVEIRVRDFGPGVRPGLEGAVLEAGTRDERTGGLGLGLHMCRTLLAAEDATIDILPADARSPGCVVVLGLPAAECAGGERGEGDGDGAERSRRLQQERDTSPAAS